MAKQKPAGGAGGEGGGSMKLRKALTLAISNHCGLTRKAWDGREGDRLYIRPAASKRGPVFLCIGGTVKGSGWEPEAGDLLATDWYLCDL